MSYGHGFQQGGNQQHQQQQQQNSQRLRTNDPQFATFVQGVDALFNQWTALQLINEHHDNNAVLELRNATLGLFHETGQVYDDELEGFFDDFFEDNRFCFLEDGSPKEASELCCSMYRECCNWQGDDNTFPTTVRRFAGTLQNYRQQNVVSQSNQQEGQIPTAPPQDQNQQGDWNHNQTVQFNTNNNTVVGGGDDDDDEEDACPMGMNGGQMSHEQQEVINTVQQQFAMVQQQQQQPQQQQFANNMFAGVNDQQDNGFVPPPMTVFGQPSEPEQKKQRNNNQPKRTNAFVKGNDGWNTVVGKRK